MRRETPGSGSERSKFTLTPGRVSLFLGLREKNIAINIIGLK